MTAKVITVCSKCQRAVYTTDVDDKGRCCDCSTPGTRPVAVKSGDK